MAGNSVQKAINLGAMGPIHSNPFIRLQSLNIITSAAFFLFVRAAIKCDCSLTIRTE